MRVLAGVVMLVAGCGAAGGTLTGAGGNAGVGTGTGASGGWGNIPGISIGGQGNASGGGNCPNMLMPVQPLPPDVLIALDTSSSMNDDLTGATCVGGCGQTSKWAAAAAAINRVVASTGGRVNWGIELFATEDINLCGSAPGVYVDNGPMSASMIEAALRHLTMPNGGVYGAATRQTRGAVDTASARLLGHLRPSSKHIVLITDGAPICAPDGAAFTDDTAATVASITATATAGVSTFVVGVATGGGPADPSVRMMGDAGVGDGGSGGSFITSTGDDIHAALNAVADETADCTFALPPAPVDGISIQNHHHIGVVVNGSELAHDTTWTNGWDYVDDSHASVRLYGNPCAAAKAAGPGVVAVFFKCITI